MPYCTVRCQNSDQNLQIESINSETTGTIQEQYQPTTEIKLSGTAPTFLPSASPSAVPTYKPSNPSQTPSYKPSNPSRSPTKAPHYSPTYAPSRTDAPTPAPSTLKPTPRPSREPSYRPSSSPTCAPTFRPSQDPTFKPTLVSISYTQLPLCPSLSFSFISFVSSSIFSLHHGLHTFSHTYQLIYPT